MIETMKKALHHIRMTPVEVQLSSDLLPKPCTPVIWNGIKITECPYMPKGSGFAFNDKQEIVGHISNGELRIPKEPIQIKFGADPLYKTKPERRGR